MKYGFGFLISGFELRAPGLTRNPELKTRTFKSGFTMIELVTVMVILGIVAAIAIPRFFSRDAYDSRSFYDQVIATLRYAQKAAIAQRRFVCVTFTANSVTLTTGVTAACGAGLSGPAGAAPYSVSSTSATFAATPPPFHFDALGKASAAQDITVSGHAAHILVDAETGYVR
jgi:MSHA pilin protein MshC